MNKYKQLLQQLIRQSVICVAVIAAFAGLYFFTGSMVDSSATKKSTADSTLSKEQGEITSLSGQLDKSGVAEKKFLSLQNARDNSDFSVNSDTLKDWLRNAKAQYRFSNSFKLSITSAVTSTNPDFSGMNYDVIEHPDMRLEFSAMSDTHIFSFLDTFVRNAPGFIRIDSLELKRVNDIDTSVISQVRSGTTPYLVDAKIDFNWIGLKEKPKDASAAKAGDK